MSSARPDVRFAPETGLRLAINEYTLRLSRVQFYFKMSMHSPPTMEFFLADRRVLRQPAIEQSVRGNDEGHLAGRSFRPC
jgi:hypothetical protein